MPLLPPVTITVRPSRLNRSFVDMLVPRRRPRSIARRHLAEQDVDGLDLGVTQQLIDGLFAPEPRILEAAEWRAVEVARGAVDPDITGLHRARGAEGGLEIVGKDGGGEAVLSRIGKLERLILVLPRKHRQHRTENLFLGNAHVAVDAAEHGRLQPKTAREIAARRALAAGHQLGAVGNAGLHHRYDALVVALGVDRPHLRFIIERIAESQSFDALRDAL